MRARLFGRITRPAVCVIGVWDPILLPHKQLYQSLNQYARSNSLCSLAIAIDPDPVRYLHGAAECPVYNDVYTRISQILACGLDGVLRVRFVAGDIDRSAVDLFTVVDQCVEIGELWLGARQSLGRLERGNLAAIMRIADGRRLRVTRLPYQPLGTRLVRQLLKSGHVIDASRLVGQPPIRAHPRSGMLRLAWCPGTYKAVPMQRLDESREKSHLDLHLVPQTVGAPRLSWPDKKIRYLAFVSGPGDATGTLGSEPPPPFTPKL